MFKYLVWISAITIALVAAFFSVTGIATLFSGKFFAVMAMASALEIGKLVAASFLYRYWIETAKLLKTYLMAGVAVLMVITSIGIYGYLSAAYAEVAAVPQNTLNQISAIDTRQSTLNSDIQRWTADNTNIDSRRTQAQAGLDNVLAGGTDLNQRSAFANIRTEIEQLDAERRTNNTSITSSTSERDSLENVKVTLNAELNTNSEIGTFIYIARTLGLPLDTVVKWFVLIIVFVFDPMAISLILAYNSIVMRERRGEPIKEDPGMRPIWINDPKAHKEQLEKEAEVFSSMKDELPWSLHRDKHEAQLNRADQLYQRAKPFVDLMKDWPEERKKRVEDKKLEMLAQYEVMEDQDVAPTRPLKQLPPNLDEFTDAEEIREMSSIRTLQTSKEEVDIPQEEDVAEPPKLAQLQPGWSLGGGPNWNNLPYFQRPGYMWELRRAEWEKDPAAVAYYDRVVNPRPPQRRN